MKLWYEWKGGLERLKEVILDHLEQEEEGMSTAKRERLIPVRVQILQLWAVTANNGISTISIVLLDFFTVVLGVCVQGCYVFVLWVFCAIPDSSSLAFLTVRIDKWQYQQCC